jgi:AICAR transformylase/IMP cyclohydrolase PurH
VENIDIGGPSMLRSGAKNHASVAVVSAPSQYGALLAELAATGGATTRATRTRLAAAVYAATAAYDECGFTAAAITASTMLTGAPQLVERIIRRVDLTFDRPHAVIAIARGGPWEGVPVFNAWVTGS